MMQNQQIKAVFFNNNPDGGNINNVYGKGRKEQIAELCQVFPQVITSNNLENYQSELDDLQVIFSTWGMPALTDEQLALLPSLEAVFYAAGAVKYFAHPFLERDIIVCSAWAANAVPVAEFCLAHILLACKNYFANSTAFSKHSEKKDARPSVGPGAFGEKIAIIGAGKVGRKLIELLKPFNLEILLVDPYVSKEDAAKMGVTLVTMGQAFKQGYVISNHLPNFSDLVNVYNKSLFSSMRKGATFLNTGRGAQVNENDLIEVFTQRQDLTAVLDVTFPEPPEPDSQLYQLDNIHLSSHIAGSVNDEVVRMADYMIAEFKRWQAGQPLCYQVTQQMLKTMA